MTLLTDRVTYQFMGVLPCEEPGWYQAPSRKCTVGQLLTRYDIQDFFLLFIVILSTRLHPQPFAAGGICLGFRDRVSLCSSSWPGTYDPPASASEELGLELCCQAERLVPLFILVCLFEKYSIVLLGLYPNFCAKTEITMSLKTYREKPTGSLLVVVTVVGSGGGALLEWC